MSERERFEKWRDGIRFPYPDAESGYAWEGWQACAAENDAKIGRLEAELSAVRDEWNRIVKASGSPTHGTAIGHVLEMRSRIERLQDAADELLVATTAYRKAYAHHGDDDMRTGRAWDQIRKAEKRVSEALAASPATEQTNA